MKIKNTLITLVLATVFTLSFTGSAFAVSKFQEYCSDVQGGHWAYSDIKEAFECGEVKGYPDKTFRPDQAITPGEFFKMAMVAALGKDPGSSKEGNWVSSYEKLMFENMPKCINGFNELTHNVMVRDVLDSVYKNGRLTREDAAMIAGVAVYIKEGQDYVLKLKDKKMYNFKDIVHTKTFEKIDIAVKSGIVCGSISGIELELRPTDKLTRAEAVVLAARIRDNGKRIDIDELLKTKITTFNENLNNIDLATEEEVASDVLKYTNEEREKAGLKKLKMNNKLSNVAKLKAKDFSDNRYFAHESPKYGSPFDMIKSFGMEYQVAGENIAYGYDSGESVVNAWMESQGHRDNILNRNFDEIGIGVYNDKGSIKFVQMFVGYY
ncbi:MAG: CAP domain-containing protein [Anaerovoracaceae bacterium]|jgi:uncharacterized YkwD family protein